MPPQEPALGSGSADDPDNTPRSDTSVVRGSDEGIVQPVSKEMEQLSRRLHQSSLWPQRPEGRLLVEAHRVAKYREVHSLSPVDAAYIAGLVDGEGTITLSRKHADEGRQLVISISSTERPILDFARERIGAGKITTKKTAKAHHAQASLTPSGIAKRSTCFFRSSLSFVPTSVIAGLSCAIATCDSPHATASTRPSSWPRGSDSKRRSYRYARIPSRPPDESSADRR